jgi:hypothetical protein
MNYSDDIKILNRMMNDYHDINVKAIEHGLGDLYSDKIEALNDAISALKTLDDMGDAMNKILREEHKPE